MRQRSWPFLAKTAISILLLFSLGTVALGGEQIAQVQERLSNEGHDPGPIDGWMGPQTEAAIRDFQEDEGLRATGTLNEETLNALGMEAEEAQLPSGTAIHVRLDDYLDSGEAEVGETFSLTVSKAVETDLGVAVPEGSRIEGRVVEVTRAARPQKAGKLVLEPTALSVRGKSIPIEGTITAEGGEVKGEGSAKEDLKKIGIGAGVGAVIGGILKGGKGALAGLLIGGGGTFLGTKGEQVELPVETPLIVELGEPVNVPAIG